MIDLTIKTLDSQNHAFSVDDDITVAQFKERIAEVINIPVDSQRLIYCGRVLQDNKKLQEYDVNGKVVHLVQRAPPSAARRTRSPQPSSNTGRRGFPGFNGSANAMYLGSMAFPSGLMEAQGIVPPPPTQSLSGSRLNVARRMLRRAENILNSLEDPQGGRSRESPSEETQDDVTPVFAAQVFVPNSHNYDPLASLTAAVSAVENDILRQAQTENGADSSSSSSRSAAGNDAPEDQLAAAEEDASATVTAAPTVEPSETAATNAATLAAAASNVAASATENQDSGNASANGNASGRLPENSSGTIEMSRLLDDLNKVQERLRPFMERYHTFMRNDPALNSDELPDVRQTQTIINRVSEIMHLLGHAYHSLSDVMVQVNTAPPRPLLCRPILIQHSAVVQAGIPIQVEAQINLTPDRRPSDGTTTTTGQNAASNNSNEASANNESGGGNTTPSQATGQQQQQQQPNGTINGPIQAQIRPNIHEIRIDSFPFEFRGFGRPPMFNISTGQGPFGANQNNQGQQQQTTNGVAGNNGSQQASATAAASNAASNAAETNNEQQQQPPAAAAAAAATTGPTTGSGNDPVVGVVPPFVNNPNMEFFMEVTPESITIDSLETTVVTSAAQADNVLRGTFGSAPPEFIQSILQAVAGQMMGANASTTPAAATPTPAASNTTATPPNSSTTTTETSNENAATLQHTTNSQARGNTQTHPTTATQTRSTSRPHVHLAQHTMQGFDPFLPCNSHHIRRRRLVPNNVMPVPNNVAAAATNNSSGGGGASRDGGSGGATTATSAVVAAANAAAAAAAATATAAAAAAAAATATAAATGLDGADHPNQSPIPLYNILQGLLRSVESANRQLPSQQREREQQQQRATQQESSPQQQQPPPLTPTANPIDPMMNFSDISRMIDLSRMIDSGQGTTLATFLQHFPDHQYTEGESLFTDLVMTLAHGLTFSDVIALNTGHIDSLVRIRPALRTFFRNRVLEGECPTQAAIDRGANRLIDELQPIFELMNTMRVRDNIDIVESATQLCRSRFPNIISLVMSRMNGTLRSLVDQCLSTIRQLCALILHSCIDGQEGVEEIFRTLITRYTVGVSPDIHQWTITTSLAQIRHFLRTLDISSNAIQPYIVVRSPTTTNQQQQQQQQQQQTPPSNNIVPEQTEPEAMECEDSPVIETATIAPLSTDGESMPSVVIGSETWHRGLSADWIPIIARDSQRQRRQNPQAPFSDAYLSGMPSKRRKIVAASKPHGTLSQVISEGVRHAVNASGLTNAVPLDVVSQAASNDLTLQSAYRDLLRSSVQNGLRDNPDFTPERFPNAASYFNLK